MRPADINRARRALEHLDMANTQLAGIKWDNLTGQDYALKQSLVLKIQAARWTAEDFIRIGGGQL